MAEIQIISKGKEHTMLIDDEDLPIIEACGNIKLDKGYARTSLGKKQIDKINEITNLHLEYKKRKGTNTVQNTISIHRLIMGVKDSKIQIDHKNGNKLDNRKENLRTATHKQNQRNKKKAANNKTGYKGVEYVPQTNKTNPYKMKIQCDSKIIQKYFKTLEEAARAYDHAALELFGEFAALNFPGEHT